MFKTHYKPSTHVELRSPNSEKTGIGIAIVRKFFPNGDVMMYFREPVNSANSAKLKVYFLTFSFC